MLLIQSLRYPIDMLQPSSAEKGTSEEAEKEDKNNYFKFVAKSKDEAEIFIFEEIGEDFFGEGMTAKKFKDELKALGNVKNITLHVNSVGGSVFEGIAIHNLLKRHAAHITAFIDGIAASIASVIVMSADEIIIPPTGMIMIHNPGTFAFGTAADFRKTADDLDSITGAILASYLAKSHLSEERIKEMMDAETWMVGEEAVELGFADTLEKSEGVENVITEQVININGRKVDISSFKSFPVDNFKNETITPGPEEETEPEEKIEPEEIPVDNSKLKMAALRNQEKINSHILQEV